MPDPIKKQGIKRLAPGADTLDFVSLRKQGIDYVQQLAGDIWTDYNLHDPGVTILPDGIGIPGKKACGRLPG
jgi:hypothetical protein